MFLTATGIVNEWPVSYHGTAKHNANSIAEQGYLLSKGERFHFGRDIYSTPDINVAAFYATRFSCEGVNYRMVIQNRVNPETFVRISPEKTLNGEYWISPNNEDVRPYGICFKKDLVKSKPLEQNKRQSSLINEFPSFGNTEDVSLEGSNQFENILREKSDSFLANYNNETFENFPTGENPSDLDLDLATTNYFDNTKELDDKEQSTEFANYKNISLEQEAIELPVEPASLVGGNTNPDLIEPYSEKQLILEALGEQNKGIALNKGVPIKKVFDGIFNRGNEEIQETPSRKRVTSTQFLTKLRHYAFLANEASCGTYGDAPFSDEIRGCD
ncbi:hypothetical protein G9A89_005997 [Geosiphon pyriformis]|nr:hypothetical protein G9A89_005997 [Geosiphon pyriformis]